MTSEKKSIYPKNSYVVGSANGVTLAKRSSDKIVSIRHNTPGNIIVIHGVNDTGTAYASVERGLCEGLSTRLSGDLKSAEYRLPTEADRNILVEDPDATFYKRTITADTLSPVIPFYWGYREVESQVKTNAKLSRGQALDRYGNRLDKDHSKGGGPFANATTTLQDMWNKGKWGVFRSLDFAQHDATHPVLNNPGRMYMILAAQRLAALICMIRDYDEDETVSIVAHSQGCLISLLAQAFLLDPRLKAVQANARPADTLIMTHPPYSLIDDLPLAVSVVDGNSGEDEIMQGRYDPIDGTQTFNARLMTLANIVKGIQSEKHLKPPLAELSNAEKYCGAVGKGWKVQEDRDNRGKVYLYFCPEDMTVALDNVQGIGWQGMPEFQRGKARIPPVLAGTGKRKTSEILGKPLETLGDGFRQRVFTAKKRPDPRTGNPVLIGPAPNRYYFILRQPGEDDFAHTEVSDSFGGRRVHSHLPQREKAAGTPGVDEKASAGLRLINGEALRVPVTASLLEGSVPDNRQRPGASEGVDQIDAAIAVTSNYGVDAVWQLIKFPVSQESLNNMEPDISPSPQHYSGLVVEENSLRQSVQAKLNEGKPAVACCEVLAVYICVARGFTTQITSPPTILINRTETPDEARFRWQHQYVPRSFHGAIFGGQSNHRHVTAYDVAIGSGKASSDPAFYQYLCAVADWRLKNGGEARKGMLQWHDFCSAFRSYFEAEVKWRRDLIVANVNYYTNGNLPPSLPVPPEGFPVSFMTELT